VLRQLLRILHRVALIQQIPTAIDPDFEGEILVSLASSMMPEDIQLYYQIGLLGQKDLDLAPDPRSGFEMVMLRMLTFRPVALTTSHPVNIPQTSSIISKAEKFQQPTPNVSPLIINESRTQKTDDGWIGMIAAMKISGLTRELANNCVLEAIDDSVCTLRLDPNHKQLRSGRTEENLQKALQAYRGKPIKLVFNAQKILTDTPAVQLIKEREDRQQAAVDTIHADHTVQALKENFDARIIAGTIESL
jgi:DNA polymerase-3 subunit gamma/tau